MLLFHWFGSCEMVMMTEARGVSYVDIDENWRTSCAIRTAQDAGVTTVTRSIICQGHCAATQSPQATKARSSFQQKKLPAVKTLDNCTSLQHGVMCLLHLQCCVTAAHTCKPGFWRCFEDDVKEHVAATYSKACQSSLGLQSCSGRVYDVVTCPV